MLEKLSQFLHKISIYGFWSSKLFSEDLRISLKMLKPFIWMGFIGILGQTFAIFNFEKLGAMLLWSMAAMSFGTALGFLFGVPKSGSGTRNGEEHKGIADSSSSRPNTNLEEISDWLTKIIVGLTLVNTETIMNVVTRISHKIDGSMATPSVGLALLIGFLVIGFLYGYFYTRLFLQKAFIDSDNKLNNLNQLMNAIASNPTPRLPIKGEPVQPTAAEIKNAQLIATLAPKDKPELIVDSVTNLAASYDRSSLEMPESDEQTRWMSGIASRIRQYGLASTFLLPQLTKSDNAGERFAAICILQMSFQPLYIDWLAERLYKEQRFPAYLAASTLYNRLAVADNAECIHIRNAVVKAQGQITESDKGCDLLISKIIAHATASPATPPDNAQ